MATENLPSIQQNNFPTLQEMTMIGTIAKHAQASGLYAGIGAESKIFMILMAAHELGIQPLVALNGGLYIVKGKVEISARMMNSKIRQAGHYLDIDTQKEKCIIKAKRKDTGEEHEEIFTWEMAQRAGLTGGDNWKKYSEDMLFARCMSRVARKIFPDVISTAYVQGEIGGPINENELQHVIYEDITQKNENNISQNALPPIESNKISDEQSTELESILKQLGQDARTNTYDHFKAKFNIDDPKDLPASEYKTIISRLTHVINCRKNKEMDYAHG